MSAFFISLAIVAAAPKVVSVDLSGMTLDAATREQLSKVVTVAVGDTLSQDAVAKSIEGLYAYGRFAEVTALLTPVETGVVLKFRLSPKKLIGRINFAGAHTVKVDALRNVSRLSVNDEYWPERLERVAATIQDDYQARGYPDARVQVEAKPLETLSSLYEVTFTIREGEPRRITAIDFTGQLGLPKELLESTFKLRVGDVLDRSRVEAGVLALKELYRSRKYYRSRVESPDLSPEGKVTIPITAGMPYEFRFSGNRAFSDSSLRAILGYKGDEGIDGVTIRRLTDRIVRYYRFHGYHDVQVTAEEYVRGDESEAAVGFAIVEGPLLLVSRFNFQGRKGISQKELEDVIQRAVNSAAPEVPFEVKATDAPAGALRAGRPTFAASLPAPPGRQVYEADAWGEAVKAMNVLYRNKGYLQATVRFDRLSVAPNGIAEAQFTVQEGPQTLFRTVQATGMPPKLRVKRLESYVGTPFTPDRLEDARKQVQTELSQSGYLFSSVTASARIAPEGNAVDAQFSVDLGPLVRVRAVLVSGNKHTSEGLIYRQAGLKTGQILDTKLINDVQNRLYSLGIFRTVEVELLGAQQPEEFKTVVISVRERPRYSLDFGAGYFLATGPRVVANFGVGNIGGQGVNLTGNAQIDLVGLSQPVLTRLVDLSDLGFGQQIGGRAALSLQSRSLLPPSFGLRFDTVFDRVFRSEFRFNRFTATPTLEWATAFTLPGLSGLNPSFRVSLQYEIEWSNVERTKSTLSTSLTTVNVLDQQRLRFLFGTFVLQSGRVNATLDLRDSSISPHKGLLLQGSLEVTGSLLARDAASNPVTVEFIKASGLGTVYLPIGSRVVLALSARGGQIFPLKPESVTPPVRRFFLGGATSIRGFNEDQLLAEDLRARYRSELAACRTTLVRQGCTQAAQALMAGLQVPSQGGELYLLTKSELRFPIYSPLEGGVFFEAGNLWLARPEYIAPLRLVVGGGLRYATPIGAMALDLGFNLKPDTNLNEPTVVVHFSIGLF